MPSVVSLLSDALGRAGVDAGALGLAWARTLPAVTLVPAFGLRALPRPAQALIGLSLAGCIAPALEPAGGVSVGPWFLAALGEVLRGIPVALAAAVPLWAATMAGGVADSLRASQETLSVPPVEGRPTPLGVPFSLLASAIFLTTGGPARVVRALALHRTTSHPLQAASNDLVSGIAVAVAIGGPLLAAAVVIEIAAALVARFAAPAQVHTLLAPLRALAILSVMGVLLDRLAGALALAVQGAP